MYRILIADDNPLIRMGIKNMIDWKGFHAELAGEAKDGEEALVLLRERNPDLLITDIRMPGKDGLYLLDKVKSDYPNMHTIVISAYEEFEYAKRALRAGSVNYILKPINPKELNTSIKDALELKKGSAGFEQVLEQCNDESILVALKCKEKIEITDLLQIFANDPGVSITKRGEVFCIVYSGNNRKYEEVKYCILEKLPGQMLIGNARTSDYNSIEEAWESALEDAASAIIRDIDVINDREDFKPDMLSEDTIVLLCQSGNDEKIHEICHSLFQAMARENRENYDDFIKPIVRFLRTLMLVEEKNFQKIKAILDKVEKQKHTLNYFSIAEMEEEIKDAISELCTTFQRISGSKKELVEKVKEMIEKNYQQDISLGRLAQLFYVSQPYLSKIFKQEMGVNLNNYITEVRMQRAKYLLEETDKKVSEIARMVGYEEPNYFTKVYKKNYGILPSTVNTK